MRQVRDFEDHDEQDRDLKGPGGRARDAIDTKTRPGELCLSLLMPWWTRDTATVQVKMDLSVGWLDGSLILARKTSNCSFSKLRLSQTV